MLFRIPLTTTAAKRTAVSAESAATAAVHPDKQGGSREVLDRPINRVGRLLHVEI